MTNLIGVSILKVLQDDLCDLLADLLQRQLRLKRLKHSIPILHRVVRIAGVNEIVCWVDLRARLPPRALASTTPYVMGRNERRIMG